MKKPVVDYRDFRLSRLNDPRFSHLKLLFGWVIYFVAYFLTEKLIPPERCAVIHCPLDDSIPFCEWFLIPYFGWYFLVAGSLLYFVLYRVEAFKNLSKYLIVTQIAAMILYVLFPSRQDLRPAAFPRENILTGAVGLLYAIDTSTNVCPSLHVAFSLGLISVWFREKTAPFHWKVCIGISAILVCLSTMFIKQHSALDVLAAIPVCLLAEIIIYGKFYYFRRSYET